MPSWAKLREPHPLLKPTMPKDIMNRATNEVVQWCTSKKQRFLAKTHIDGCHMLLCHQYGTNRIWHGGSDPSLCHVALLGAFCSGATFMGWRPYIERQSLEASGCGCSTGFCQVTLGTPPCWTKRPLMTSSKSSGSKTWPAWWCSMSPGARPVRGPSPPLRRPPTQWCPWKFQWPLRMWSAQMTRPCAKDSRSKGIQPSSFSEHSTWENVNATPASEKKHGRVPAKKSQSLAGFSLGQATKPWYHWIPFTTFRVWFCMYAAWYRYWSHHVGLTTGYSRWCLSMPFCLFEAFLRRRAAASKLPWPSQHRGLRPLCASHDWARCAADEQRGFQWGNGLLDSSSQGYKMLEDVISGERSYSQNWELNSWTKMKDPIQDENLSQMLCGRGHPRQL